MATHSHNDGRLDGIGAVVIGRNEGQRLAACIASLRACQAVVYVDSASTDDSVALARGQKANVVELDVSIPFTAARARNAGFARLTEIVPDLAYVHFVDGDCEVLPGWVEAAAATLTEWPDVAAVCGRRLERFPEASIYNAMCHREWNTPVGEADACGGDALMRADAFQAVGGFNDAQIAHEEPELCGRLRGAGYRILRIDRDMTWHDAAILRLGQFLKRNRRAGFGLAQCGASPDTVLDRLGSTILKRSVAWGLLLPLLILVAVVVVGPAALLLLLLYPLQVLRLAMRDGGGYGGSLRRRLQVYGLLTLAKFAEARGAVEYAAKRLSGQTMGAIIYK